MKSSFTPGTRIVTAEGNRGYVVKKIPLTKLYEIRVTQGYSIRSEKDLQLDTISKWD